MTSGSQALQLDIRPRSARPKREWRRGVRALRRLVRSPEQTELAFEVFDALDSDLHERALARMLAHPEGRRLYADRPSLREILSDRNALEQMPDGSFGRAYLEHLERHGLDPTKLVRLERDHLDGSKDPDVRWMAERSQLTHDLWHVLSGYGADQLGESALLWFSLAQAGGRANAILSLGASLHVLRERGPGWIPYAWKSWRRGRRSACLHAVPYEELLPLPLDDVRAALGIDDPERAHRGGVIRGSPIPNAPASRG